jgi:hypothetical protein
MPAPPLVMQTVYAELMERCAAHAFNSSSPQKADHLLQRLSKIADTGTFNSRLTREELSGTLESRHPNSSIESLDTDKRKMTRKSEDRSYQFSSGLLDCLAPYLK